jgi:hypothetical protein
MRQPGRAPKITSWLIWEIAPYIGPAPKCQASSHDHESCVSSTRPRTRFPSVDAPSAGVAGRCGGLRGAAGRHRGGRTCRRGHHRTQSEGGRLPAAGPGGRPGRGRRRRVRRPRRQRHPGHHRRGRPGRPWQRAPAGPGRPVRDRQQHQDLHGHPHPATGRRREAVPDRHRRTAPTRPRPGRRQDHPEDAAPAHQRAVQLHRPGLHGGRPRGSDSRLDPGRARRHRDETPAHLRPRHRLGLLQHQLHPGRDDPAQGHRHLPGRPGPAAHRPPAGPAPHLPAHPHGQAHRPRVRPRIPGHPRRHHVPVHRRLQLGHRRLGRHRRGDDLHPPAS